MAVAVAITPKLAETQYVPAATTLKRCNTLKCSQL